MAAIQILAKPDAESALLATCFNETTTIGIRKQLVNRSILKRKAETINDEGDTYRVKIVQRPASASVKLEMDDLTKLNTDMQSRKVLRNRIEGIAEKKYKAQKADE